MSIKSSINANDVSSQVYIKRHVQGGTYFTCFTVYGGLGVSRIFLLKLLNGILLPLTLSSFHGMVFLFFY